MDHLIPFQCRASFLDAWYGKLETPPTAQQLPGPVQVTPPRPLWSVAAVPGSGVGTTDQVVPFQCRASLDVCLGPLR